MIFISHLAQYVEQNKEIIYIDETSTHLWEIKKKIWQPRHATIPMTYDLPKERGSNVTVIGAITSKSDKLYFLVRKTTNIEYVKDFIEYL